MRKIVISLIILSGYSLQASDFHSPRTLALGGSGHAGPLLNDAIFLNPSYSSFLPTYSMGMNYLAFSGDTSSTNDPVSKGKNYSFSIQDGRSELFQAGAAYTVRGDGKFVHIGASKSFVNRFGFGLGGKFFFNDKDHTAGRDASFSTTSVLAEWMQASLIVDNIFETNEGKNRGLYREYTLGLKLNGKSMVMGYVDPHLCPNSSDGKKYGYEAGVEFVMMSDFFLRLGMFKNASIPFQAARGRGYGAGVGWIAPRISFDYGFSRVIEPAIATVHAMGATVYF